MRQGRISIHRLVRHEFNFLSRYDPVIPLSRLTFIFATSDVMFNLLPFRSLHDVVFILRLIVFNSAVLHAHLIEIFIMFILCF